MSVANHSDLGKYFEFFETILVEVTGATNPCIGELYQNGIFACCKSFLCYKLTPQASVLIT